MSHQASRGWFVCGVVVSILLAGAVVPVLGSVVSYTTDVANYHMEVKYSEEFGDPIPSYNGLMFFPDPTVFCAEAAGAFGSDAIDGYFRAVITGLDDAPINMIRLWEYGEYTLRGTGTALTEACVDVPITVVVTEVGGSPVTPQFYYPTMTFHRPNNEPPLPANPDGDYNLVDDRGNGVLWVGESTFDVGNATQVVVLLDNILSVQTEEYSEAKMLKKGLTIDIVVPEPSMLALLMGIGCVLIARRRG